MVSLITKLPVILCVCEWLSSLFVFAEALSEKLLATDNCNVDRTLYNALLDVHDNYSMKM